MFHRRMVGYRPYLSRCYWFGFNLLADEPLLGR